MSRRISPPCVLFLLLLVQMLCSGSILKEEAFRFKTNPNHSKKFAFSISISTTQNDVTTPTITPTTPVTTPNSNPLSPTTATPITNPTTTTTTPPVSGGGSWCVASQSASETALQVALDYACGYGGADCSAIQAGGSCYNPITVRDHASFAFNNYYQKNPVPTSCNFGGTAVISTTDPSSGTCQYPTTSTSSSVLNTTTPTGSTIFGSTPSSPSTSSTATPSFPFPFFFFITCFIILLPRFL